MNFPIFTILPLLSLTELSIIIDIFKYKNIYSAVFLQCDNPISEVSLERLFSNNIKISSVFIKRNVSCEIPYSYTKIGLIVNASSKIWPEYLDCMEQTAFYKSPFVWLIFTEDLSSVTEVLSTRRIEIDSDVTVIVQNGSILDLFEVYNTGVDTNGSFKVNHLGWWNSGLYIKKTSRFDLSGVMLKCMSVINPRAIKQRTLGQYLDESKRDKVDSLHRLKYFTPMKYMRDMYGWSYELHRTNSWGYLRNKTHFDGMVGSLQRKESDIGCSPVFIRTERARVIDYAVQTWDSKQCFILRHPKHPDGFYKIYTRPLDNDVWLCSCAMLLLAGILLGVLARMNILRQSDDEEDASWSLVFLSICSAVCQQGVSIQRGATSVKIVTFVTFVFTVTLYQYYNATVVSTLLKDPPKSIRSLKDLLKSNLKIGIQDVAYNRDFFKRTTDPVALELYQKKVITGDKYNFFPPDYGMALVQRGGFAFHVEGATGYGIMRETFSEREVCEAHEVTLYPPQTMGAVVKKGSPYKEHVTYAIRKMWESGIMTRILRTWDARKPACVRTTEVYSVTVQEFSLALVLLAGGAAAATVILLVEILLSLLHTLPYQD